MTGYWMLLVIVLIALLTTAWYVVFSPDATGPGLIAENASEGHTIDRQVTSTESHEENEES